MLLLFLTFFTFICGCSRTTIDNPDYVVAHVDSTRHIHWGRGYYKLRVYYSFPRKTSIFNGVYENKLERSYTATYEAGDSVLVKFDSENPKYNELIKIIYNKE